MKWFRFYHEAYRNPKVQDMRPELFKFWVNFLCVASESKPRGRVASEGHLRLALGLAKPLCSRYVSELEAMALLRRDDAGGLTPHDWHALQRESDDSAKRQSEKRARDSGKQPSEMSRDMSRDKNVTVTRLDTDRERDTEEEDSPPPPSGGRASRKTMELPDWVPEADWGAYLQMRQRIRKPATDRAKELAIGELDKLRGEGHDPGAVLRQSVLHSWQGLFPIKANGVDRGSLGARHQPATPEQLQSLSARLKGGHRDIR